MYYPPITVKKKPLPHEEPRIQSSKKPTIEYPLLKKTRRRKLHPIDFVPRRKQKQAIISEIQSNYSEILPPPIGKNREKMKKDLQEKFQFSEGVLFKSVIKKAPMHKLAPRQT